MLRAVVRVALPISLSLSLLAAAGCKRGGGGAAPDGGDKGAQPAQPALLPVGTLDPFPRLSGLTAKALDRGYRALKAKKPDEAAAAFAEVLAAAPDHTSARFQMARALAQAGKLAEARAQLEELLARDFVAYAGRAATGREWKALRDSPEWATLQAAEGRYRAAYAAGLGGGFLFVARSRPAKVPAPAGGEARVELNQDAYHYDPATGRYRRLSGSGQVYAAMRSPDGKTLAFLLVSKLRKGPAGDLFVEPQAGYVDLVALETVGPFKLDGAYHEVVLGFGAAGPLWATQTAPGQDGGTFQIDTARTGLGKGAAAPGGRRTWAQAAQVWHSGQQGSPEGVTLGADGRSFTLAGGGAVTAARELAPTSIEWSPGKARLTYAGKLDACKVLAEGDKAAKNELFVYDVEKKSAQRIDSGISEFETLWLGDDVLAYENGIGQKGTVNLYVLSAHKRTQLAPRHGAGLYGVPSLRCQAAEPEEGAEPQEAPPELPEP